MCSAALPHLVADIGGTNTRVALSDGAALRSDTIMRFANDDFADLDSVLRRYLAAQGVARCGGACIAMAGPVADGVARLTNRDWSMECDRLARVTGAQHSAILNDLQAQGHALGALPPSGTRLLQPAQTVAQTAAQGAQLVIGIGTGFNIAQVLMTTPLRTIPPAEAGHALLPLRSAEDLRLADFLARDHGMASIEDLLSGRGVAAAYRWAAHEAGADAALSGRAVLAAAEAGDPIAAQARAALTRAMGTVFSNLAITFLPFGGIYLSGGVARALSDQVNSDMFRSAFFDKGRFRSFMGQFAIHVIEDDCAALIGCAAHLDAVAQAG